MIFIHPQNLTNLENPVSRQPTTVEIFQSSGNPVIVDNRIYLCWAGRDAPQIISDLNDWDTGHPTPLQPVGHGVWACQVELELGSYLEYAFVRDGRRVSDPRNPRRTPNGMGKFNHYFTYPLDHGGYRYPWKAHPLRGELTQAQLPCEGLLAGAQRSIHYYQPPVFHPVPLMVVWDGQDYLNRAHLPWILDALIAAGQVQPLALAMIENGRRYRNMEYLCSEATLGFLHYFLLPHARQSLQILDPADQPGCYAVCGASFGGLMALYTGLRMPEVFGKVISQSGAFSIQDVNFVVWDLIEARSDLPFHLWMDCGKYESLLACNRQMAALLTQKAFSFDYHEFPAGHNYPAWQAVLPRALAALFGH